MSILRVKRIAFHWGLALSAFAVGFAASYRGSGQSQESADFSPTRMPERIVSDGGNEDLATESESSQMRLLPEAFAEIKIDWFDDELHLTDEAAYSLGLTNDQRSEIGEIARRTRDELQHYERENVYKVTGADSPYHTFNADTVFELEPLGVRFDEFLVSYRGAIASVAGDEASSVLPLPYEMNREWHKWFKIDDKGADEIQIMVGFSQIEGNAQLSSRGIALYHVGPGEALPEQLTHLFQLEEFEEEAN